MIPAAMTANSNMLCPKSRPVELEAKLPSAATADGAPDGGARVSPWCDDEPAARTALALCACDDGHPRGGVGVPALGGGGGEGPG